MAAGGGVGAGGSGLVAMGYMTILTLIVVAAGMCCFYLCSPILCRKESKYDVTELSSA